MARLAFKRDTFHPTYLAVFLVFVALCIHAYYVTTFTKPLPHALHFNTHVPLTPAHLANSTSNYPPVFIYRRTKKSGSSAMLDALIRALQPYGYVPLYLSGTAIRTAVRAESVTPFPRRLLIAEHNRVTRADDPLRHAVIADTIRDGYEQVTSFCRYLRNVSTCDHTLVKCLESDAAKFQNRYRWGGRHDEDEDTYIDLPLSAAHPALSTTILRRVFPNVTLDMYSWNLANSKCPELPLLREVYSRLYVQLDRQVEMLRKRMLVLAGYPFETGINTKVEISLEEMLSAAEAKERQKYDIVDHGPGRGGFSESHKNLIASVMVWSRDENDSLILARRWK